MNVMEPDNFIEPYYWTLVSPSCKYAGFSSYVSYNIRINRCKNIGRYKSPKPLTYTSCKSSALTLYGAILNTPSSDT